MAGKGTDRKNKSVKDTKTAAINDKDEAVANFTLPDSLPCSEIDFPILIKKRSTANWNEIIEESNKKLKDIEEYVQSKRETPTKPPFQSWYFCFNCITAIVNSAIINIQGAKDFFMYKKQLMAETCKINMKYYQFLETECDYIVKEVFFLLIPALEETLNKAVIWDALKKQKCFFNGIDHIAQVRVRLHRYCKLSPQAEPDILFLMMSGTVAAIIVLNLLEIITISL